MKPSNLPTHKFESCTICVETGCNQKDCIGCEHCQGHGVEPVAVENPYCKCMITPSNMGEFQGACGRCDNGYQLQLGKVFEICERGATIEQHYLFPICPCKLQKFLPIRCVKEGDLSELWVVEV